MSEYELRLAPDSGEDAEEQLRSLLHWLREDENLGPGRRAAPSAYRPALVEDRGHGPGLVALITGTASRPPRRVPPELEVLALLASRSAKTSPRAETTSRAPRKRLHRSSAASRGGAARRLHAVIRSR
ncbi:hypothetical protein SCALM49S_09976 [Streptomyces californicus]